MAFIFFCCIFWDSLPVHKGLLRRIHDPKLRNMAQALSECSHCFQRNKLLYFYFMIEQCLPDEISSHILFMIINFISIYHDKQYSPILTLDGSKVRRVHIDK